MKKILIALLLLLFFITGFSQNLNYEVHGNYIHSVKKEILNKSNSIGDIIPYYPTGWIGGYISVEISATSDGKTVMAEGANDTLNDQQKDILTTAVLGTDIVINIKYKQKNWVNDKVQVNIINYTVTIVPDIEAEFPGGNELMTKYLKENAINKISETTSKELKQGIVRFTVNEEGTITDAKIFKTSGDLNTDKLLLEVINKMPKWRAAEDSNGIKVKQEFEFSVGNVGC
jgi:TonB family protein